MTALLVKTGLALLGLYGLITFGTYALQQKLLYFPDPRRISPEALGLSGVTELELPADGGARIVAWYAPARPGQPTLLYFHGNGGALVNRAERLARYRDRGRGILMMAYRGYGGSTGRPSEAANVADATRAYDLLRSRGIAPDRIVLYGESLGSGVAVQVAAERPVAGVVLDAPYTSIVDIAERVYPLLPARWLMTDRYETLRHLPRVAAPVLVIHGEQDQVVPVEMGRRVAAAVRGPSSLVTFPGAGHSDHSSFGSFEAVNAWIDRLPPAGAAASTAPNASK